MNPNDKSDRKKLFGAIEHHYKELAVFRWDRVTLIEDYAGKFGHSRPQFKQLVNLMLQTAETAVLALAANRPRYLARAKQVQYAAFAAKFEVGLNNLVEEIRFEETMEAVVLDAFFGPGIVKTHVANSPLVEIEVDVWADPGRPFAERVSLDNWFHDTGASDFRNCTMMGDRYRIGFHELQDSDRFDQKAVKLLKPNSKNEAADDETAAAISTGDRTDEGEAYPMIDLMDVWYPEEKMLITWACDRKFVGVDTNPLNVIEYKDDEETVYDMLNLGPVPDNIMPTTPAENLRNISRLLNTLLWKLRRQAMRQKDINIFQAASADDAKRVKGAVDGEYVKVNNPDAFTQLKQGGIDPGNVGFVSQLMDTHDRMAGNLKARGGLGPQSGTVGQDQMIQAQVSEAEDGMRYKVNRFAEKVAKKLAWLMWEDPTLYIPGERKTPVGTMVRADWMPAGDDGAREGGFPDYAMDIDRLSMAYKSPAAMAAELRGLVGELVPLMPILEQQGIMFDGREYLKQLAEYTGHVRLPDIFKSMMPPPDGGSAAGQKPGMPAHTTRTNIRKSVPTGGTPESRSNLLQRQMMPGNSSANQDQAATLSR